MFESETTLEEIIKDIDIFCPVKVVFNNITLYNDYDSNIVVDEINGDKVYGELHPLSEVAESRMGDFKDYLVTSINIKIVDFHHSIIDIQGRSPSEVFNCVDVVRCKDCIHRHKENCPMYHEYWMDENHDCDLLVYNYTEDNGFCHLGERYYENDG